MPAKRSNTPLSLAALVGLRVAIGVLFLIFAEYKVLGTQFTLGGGMEMWEIQSKFYATKIRAQL